MQGRAPSLQQAVAAPGRVSSFPTLTNNVSASRNKHGRPLPSGVSSTSSSSVARGNLTLAQG